MIPCDPPAHLCAKSLHSFQQVAERIRDAVPRHERLLVGIGGPGGCGKSTLTRWLRHQLDHCRILSLDDFRLPRAVRPAHGRFSSHPDGNDLPRLFETFEAFRAGKTVRQPIFDLQAGHALRDMCHPAPRILLADGEIAAHHDLRRRFDLFILVTAHWRTQLNTRLTRDMRERGCSLEKAIDIFLHSNLRDYPRFAAGAENDAHLHLHRNTRHVFTLR